jgi:hypothetical protein
MRACRQLFIAVIAAGSLAGCVQMPFTYVPEMSGRVVSARDNSAVTGAVIVALSDVSPDKRSATKSDATGAFHIMPVNELRWVPGYGDWLGTSAVTLQISANGYVASNIPRKFNEEQDLTVRLEPDQSAPK